VPEVDKTIVISAQQPWGITTHTATVFDDDRLSIIVHRTSVGSNASEVVSGFFDIQFDVPTGRTAYLAGYTLVLSLDPDVTGVRLTGAAEATNAVFAGQIPMVFGTGNSLKVADSLPGVGQENVISDGAGLIRVLFEVQPGTIGRFACT